MLTNIEKKSLDNYNSFIDQFLDLLEQKEIITLEQKLKAIEESRKIFRIVERDKWEINLPIVYNVDEVKKILKVSRRTIYRYLDAGILRAHKNGKNFYITHDDLTKFMLGKRNNEI